MKKVVAYRFVIRMLSLLLVAVLPVLGMLADPGAAWMARAGDACLGGCLLLLLYPLKGENGRHALLQAVLIAVLMVAGACQPLVHRILWSGGLPLLLALALWIRRCPASRGAARENRMLYAFLVLAFCGVGQGLPLVPFYAVMYVLCYSGNAFTLILYLSRFRRRSEAGKCDPAQMRFLFERAERYLAREKPFLDAHYREDEMAKALFTNRVYLSQSINAVAGMTFKMLLNTYRVRHAIALMRENPSLNIKQIAHSSGFNSTNVFLAAFRMIMGESPQQHLSKMREQGP